VNFAGSKINYFWRVFGSGLGFLVFGFGAWLYAVFLLVSRVCNRDQQARRVYEQKVLQYLLKFFRQLIRQLGLVTIKINGIENVTSGKSYLILVNHPTLVDAPILLTVFPKALCIVKSELGISWVYRTVCEELGFLILGDSAHLIDSAVAALAAGRSVLLFPEGTRSHSDSLRPFERGAATIFIRTLIHSGREIEILPVTITCSPPALARGQRWYQIPDRRIDFRVTIKYPFKAENVLSLAKQNYRTDSSGTENGSNGGAGHSRSESNSESEDAVLEMLRSRIGEKAERSPAHVSRTASVELTHFLQSYFEEQLSNEQRSGR
jgi:1-acyl-sn-glycerol-3-phosphate acyltransferase